MLTKIVNGKEVELSPEEEKDLLQEWTNNEKQTQDLAYIELRRQAYGPIADQLDLMYHHGFDAWKNYIEVIKKTYPKPEKND